MTVHLFGACSSPSVATHVLHRAASNCQHASIKVRDMVFKNFYVDDCLKAGTNRDEIAEQAVEIRKLCSSAGFDLCKFQGVTEIENYLPMTQDEGSVTKTLGLIWNRERDCMRVDISEKTLPKSKRELLSIVAPVYDPLGILSPLVLKGRQLVQIAVTNGRTIDWDEPFETELLDKIRLWMDSLWDERETSVYRNVLSYDETAFYYELHFFSDASLSGHGAVAYVRFQRGDSFCCRFLWGKARVNSSKHVSVPRLELVAATLATKMRVRTEKTCETIFRRVIMWTDSQTVLKYLRNKRDRFNTFVANRVTFIKENTAEHEWRYVNSSLNPADDASRATQTERWLGGPPFLSTGEECWPEEPVADDPDIPLEVKGKTISLLVQQASGPLTEMIGRHSCWSSLRRAVGWLIVFKDWIFNERTGTRGLTVEVLKTASEDIIRLEQNMYFGEDINSLLEKGRVKKSSSLVRLDAELVDGFLRLGGRLCRATEMSGESKHPLILSGESWVAELLARDVHEKLN